MNRKIWIAWETQRRSLELANYLGCKLYVFDVSGYLRYPVCILKTIPLLFFLKADIILVQNPTIVLAALACFCTRITKTRLVVDRHSNFRLNKPQSGSFPIWLFMRFHYYSLRSADLTIVTNKYIADLVIKSNGKPVILPDKLPEFHNFNQINLRGEINILYIASFGLDEPVREVIKAFSLLDITNCCLYITGNYNKRPDYLPDKIPERVIFTGFIPENDYPAFLMESDLIIVLTKSDHCMLCGCYEAVSVGKPLITSNKTVLREYFKEAFFVENEPESIGSGIKTVLSDISGYTQKTLSMKKDIKQKWQTHYRNLLKNINSL